MNDCEPGYTGDNCKKGMLPIFINPDLRFTAKYVIDPTCSKFRIVLFI